MTKSKDRANDRPLNTLCFESPTHTGVLLSGLNSLRGKGLLLDVTLIAEGCAFQAHKVVLASCSEYFRAMFTDAMKESQQSEICLNGVPSEGMKYLLEYAYTSKLSLNLANIQDVLSAASHTQVFAVVEACSNYLQGQLDLDNCVDIVTIAETYSLFHLRKRVYHFMCDNFSKFSQTTDIDRMSLNQFKYLLECNYPVDCSEAEVFATVIRWIEMHHSERLVFACDLFKFIHIREIPTPVVQAYVESKVFRTVLAQCPPLYNKLIAHRYDYNHNYVSGLVNSRGMELALVKVGGFGNNGVTNQITYYHPSSMCWKYLTSIPHVEQCNFGTAVLNNELYVIGGCFNQSLQEHIHPFGFCYNPQFNKWTTMAPMQKERCRFSLSVVANSLYAIGGASESQGDYPESEATGEKYDPNSDCWVPIPPMPSHRAQHAASTWHNYIFVSGGLDQDFVLNSLLCYDTRTSTWESKCAMPTPRADHAMVTHGDKLYVCGGWFEDEVSGNRVLSDAVIVYNIFSNTWEEISYVPTPRYHAGMVVFENKLFIIGGFHSDVMFDRATGILECYDLEEDKWSSEESYPQDIWEHACTTLYIPTGRDDLEVMGEEI